jgi:hypothetical protein
LRYKIQLFGTVFEVQSKNKLMKKIFLFLLSVIALSQHANAQNIVDANDFFENQAKFNGRTIIFKDIIIRKGVTRGVNIGPGSQVSQGSGSASNSTGNSTRCTAPKNYEILEVVFPNGKTKGCFVILKKVANPIPTGKDVTATITFKADSRTMNKISMIKFIP